MAFHSQDSFYSIVKEQQLTKSLCVELTVGIEPTFQVYKARVMPLYEASICLGRAVHLVQGRV